MEIVLWGVQNKFEYLKDLNHWYIVVNTEVDDG